ncbi:hypothetical protein H9M94_02885 [Mycoplasma sp. Pen4]|uniref:ABC transporter permease n=1 Tax=Mycoplasma sp. Pen4 TaxID=640330 RepID=UPI001653F926|nr:ABC transporter permease [Mycoplasma sp. Pen4]QNM93532.1 hypothetical protein H9M94_02885 [Mycoplasma sp. Pen4]
MVKDQTSTKPSLVSKTILAFDGLKRFLMFEDKKTSRRKLYASLWAVVFGLLFASVLYYLLGLPKSSAQNPIHIWSFIENLISFSTAKQVFQRTTIYFIIFGFSGLAVAVAFKSGLFNIGVPGQMLLPGIVFFAIIISARVPISNVDPKFIVGMFVTFIIIGALTGAVSGALKAFFNVHEVISTIFLNWIITYISVWLFNINNHIFFGPETPSEYVFTFLGEQGGTKILQIPTEIVWNFIYFGLALLGVFVIGAWFVYSKTTLGYKIKMIGINKSNAKYVGINEKITTITIMAVSGGLAGISGFYYIVMGINRIPSANAPLNIGFESIAIALIALNNPVGVVGSSLLYALIYGSQSRFAVASPQYQISQDFFPIITGVIIFMAATSIMLEKFRPINALRKALVLLFSKEYWMNFKTYHKIGSHSFKHKAYLKALAQYKAEFLKRNNLTEIDEKNADAFERSKMLFKIKFFKEFENGLKASNKELKQLALRKQILIQDVKAQHQKELNDFLTHQKDIAILEQKLREIKAAFASAIKAAKSDEEKIKLHEELKVRTQGIHEMIASARHDISNKESQLKKELLDRINKINNDYVDDYIAEYKKYHYLTHKHELALIKNGNKDRMIEYKYHEKEYENFVAKLIASKKKASTEEKMAMYDEISKRKFELLRFKEELGLNKHNDIIEIFKAEKKARKNVFKAVKEKIYQDFNAKHFTKPYDKFVAKHEVAPKGGE